MIIVKVDSENNFHPFESQTGRDECWIDGYIQVPKTLERALENSGGFCDLFIENGALVDIIPRLDCKLDIPPAPLTREDEIDALLIEQEYRLTLLELGVSE